MDCGVHRSVRHVGALHFCGYIFTTTMAGVDEDLNAISTVNDDGASSPSMDGSELLDFLDVPLRDPVTIRGAGNVTV